MFSKNYGINKDGYNIRCRVYFEKNETIRRAVITGHGFGGHKDNKAAERFGDVREKYPEAELYGYATSFGGYLFLKYIHDHGSPFRKTALRCPAVCMYDVLAKAIMKADDHDKLSRGKDVPVGFDRKVMVSRAFLDSLNEADIRKYDYLEFAEDLLIIHGTKDEVVPFADSQTFADNNLIEFIPVENADHRFQTAELMDEAIKQIQIFFARQD